MYNPESFVKYKDLPNLTTMFGNLGNSWTNPLPNDLYIRNVRKQIKSIVTVNNGGAGALVTMHTFTLPAKSLKTNGDVLYGTSAGTFGGPNDNDRAIQFFIDGQLFAGTGVVDIDNDNAGWEYLWEIKRLSSTSVIATSLSLFNAGLIDSAGTASTPGATGSLSQARVATLTALADLDTNDVVLNFQGQGGAVTDVVQRYTNLELMRQ